MKLAFLGTSEFAVPALRALVDAGHDVAAVYTRAPKPAGRGQQERRTPVHELALSLGLPVRTPRSLRNDEEAQAFKALDLDAAVVVAYGHILPRGFLEAPVLGCINIHGSLLPRWRGAAPIHRAILAGDAETGVTTMRMDEGLDTGPMLLAERTPISAADTADTLHDRLAELGARLIVSTLDGLVRKTLEPVPQPQEGRHLRPQARQGGRRARLAAAGGRARAQGARLPSLARHVVRRRCRRRRRRTHQGPGGGAGARRRRAGYGEHRPRRLSDRGLRRRRAEAPEAAARRQVGPAGRCLPARLRPRARHGAGAARGRSDADLSAVTRYKLTLEYDGAPFVGWQRQDNGPSVQAALEAAVTAFCGERVAVQGAGRTDAGVHALGQVAHLDLAADKPADTVQSALNFHLKPHPVAVLAVEVVPADFHARFSATGRRYRYRILNRRAPPALDRGRVWHVPVPLDVDAMAGAAALLRGRHDFNSFRSAACQAASPVKTIDLLQVARRDSQIQIDVGARSFLHNQVRILVGTLQLVGRGQWTRRDVEQALAARDRARAGPTAPPQGLCLMEVRYDLARGDADDADIAIDEN